MAQLNRQSVVGRASPRTFRSSDGTELTLISLASLLARVGWLSPVGPKASDRPCRTRNVIARYPSSMGNSMTPRTEDSRAIAVEFVKAIGDGRLDDVRRLLHDDVVAHAAAGVPFSGDYHGHEGLFGLLAKIFEVLEVSLSPDIQYFADKDNVVLYYRLTLTSRTSGESIEMRVAEVLSLRDGLIVELDVFYKDPGALATSLRPSRFAFERTSLILTPDQRRTF
jgi:uncharacterized protein